MVPFSLCIMLLSETPPLLTLPSSDPDAIRESLNGFLANISLYQYVWLKSAYQSVSKTAAVCPLNNGGWSGIRPRSSRGMTAKAPPPLASQLTERYEGFACILNQSCPKLYSLPVAVGVLYLD